MAARETDSEAYVEMVIEHNVLKGMIEGQPKCIYIYSHIKEQKAEGRCLNGKS